MLHYDSSLLPEYDSSDRMQEGTLWAAAGNKEKALVRQLLETKRGKLNL